MTDTSSALQSISTAARDSIVEVLCQHASSRLIFFLNTPSIKRFNMHGIHQMQLDVNALESASNQLPTPGLKAAFAQNNQFVELFLHNRIDDISNPTSFKQRFPALEVGIDYYFWSLQDFAIFTLFILDSSGHTNTGKVNNLFALSEVQEEQKRIIFDAGT